MYRNQLIETFCKLNITIPYSTDDKNTFREIISQDDYYVYKLHTKHIYYR